ncbi:MAG: YidC/Oxa1 family membrane protein insertase [Ruminococcaceae bacterium]|nr:YidC/Oxa1 family membrane protein insertase [Oscillospiraceae bacterium]
MNIIYAPFAFLMRLFDSFTGSYALTLLLFTLLFKLVLLPLGIKQQKNQIKMAALRPKEAVIRKKYAGRTDRATQQKMQQEILELQQKENVSPFGGCMPLLIQLGLIMVIYTIIRQPLTYICGLDNNELFALTKEFNWQDFSGKVISDIKNIASLDQIKAIATPALEAALPEGTHLPNLNFFGLNLGIEPSDVLAGFKSSTEVVGVGVPTVVDVLAYLIIPVACFLLQVASMKLTRKFTYQPTAAQDAQTGCSMKLMDWMMPLMSLYFCFTFSSAIGLYWIYSNILSFVQTVILAKAMPIPQVTEEDIKAAEKEMKEKGYSTKKEDLIRVRSLHHIDDDDYDELPEIHAEAKGADQTLLNGEKVPQNTDKKPKIKD